MNMRNAIKAVFNDKPSNGMRDVVLTLRFEPTKRELGRRLKTTAKALMTDEVELRSALHKMLDDICDDYWEKTPSAKLEKE